jgi:hypothetical protein
MANPYQHAPEVSIVRTDTCKTNQTCDLVFEALIIKMAYFAGLLVLGRLQAIEPGA